MPDIKQHINTLEDQKDLFIATLIHDLKNPIRSQLSGLNLLAEGAFGSVNDEQKEIISLIKESVSFLNNLLYSALDVYKYENGIMFLNKTEFDLINLAEKCLTESCFAADEKNIKFVRNYSDIKTNITADENQIRRLITNLLNNAITYSYPNCEINVQIRKTERDVILRINNTGNPVPEFIKEHIFEKYMSGHSHGNGLGLYYCKQTALAHGGDISFDTKGNVTLFTVKLPLN